MSDIRQGSTSSTTKRHGSVVAAEPVTTVLAQGEVVYDPEDPDRVWDSDEEVLAALGYKPEFKREFTLFTTFSVSFAVLGLLPSFASTLFYGMGYAGTAGMTWGWLIAMVGIQCVAMGMAEICSSMPTSGGLYYAAAVLAPPGWGPVAAWFTGWSNWMGQVTGAPSVNYGTAAMLLAAVSINSPVDNPYVPTLNETFLLTAGIMLIHMCISSMPTKMIAQFNSYGSTFNMLALIVVIIVIPAATNRTSKGLPRFTPSSEVWGTIQNGTDFPNGVAVLMSFVAVIWTLSGYDSPFHLAEECSNANIASPRAIVLTSTIGGTFGWFLQLVVAYTVVDIDKAINSPLGQPFAAYLIQVLPKTIVTAVLALTVVAGFSMGQGCMVAASRVTFAYARDDVFPGAWWLKKVNKTTKTPVNAVIANAILGILMLLLIYGGYIAVGALFSIGALAAFIAFTIPIAIRIFFVGNRFRPGPWNLGKFSMPIGIVACSFVVLMTPIMCFPWAKGQDLNLNTMNWTCVVYGGAMFMIIIWWFVSAHKWFKGPKVNLQHMMLGREEAIITAKEEVTGDGASSGGSHHDDDGKIKAQTKI